MLEMLCGINESELLVNEESLSDTQSVARGHKRWKHLALWLLGMGGFAAIIYFRGRGSLENMLHPCLVPLVLCFLANVLMLLLSSVRWGYTTRQMTRRKTGSYAEFFLCVVTGRFFGQFVSRTGGDFLVRPGVLNRLSKIPFRSLLLPTLVDRLFDIVLMTVLVVPAACFLSGTVGPVGSSAIALSLFVALSFLVVWNYLSVFSFFCWAWQLLRRVSARIPGLRRLARAGEPKSFAAMKEEGPIIGRRALIVGFLLTGFRYIVLVLRLWLLVSAFRLAIPAATLAFGVPIAQLSLILGITPGGLGFLEGGWYAVLAVSEIPTDSIITFLITQRVYWFIFTSAIFLISYLVFGARRLLMTRSTVLPARDEDE
ncbi:lysylphosphatidylglycerol synthase transmembrane domain-containing protein [Candidatus Bipolaricaulota bacterium]